MSLKITYLPAGNAEPCDYCKASDDFATIELDAYSKEWGHHIIWVHERCLEKSMARAKKRALTAKGDGDDSTS